MIKRFSQFLLESDHAGLKCVTPNSFEPVVMNSINRYKRSISLFDTVNAALRSGKEPADMDRELRMFCENMDEALLKWRTPREMTFYRIVDLDDYPAPKRGSTLNCPGYLSTSKDIDYLLEQADNYESPLIIELTVPADTPYLMFANDFESEVLFGRGHVMTYTSDIDRTGDVGKIQAVLK